MGIFSPQYPVVSLGVDAFENDPISFLKLTSMDFLTTGEMIGSLEIPTLFVMEGAYDVDEVGANVVNVAEGFRGVAIKIRWSTAIPRRQCLLFYELVDSA
jgi:acetoin utilization deacetylase AcuC-like enzyme